MSLRIVKAGVLDSIQDRGRYGWQYLGINPAGTMDSFSASIANILVGNNPDEATIELHFPASIFLFERPALVAISGADFSATINGEPVPASHAFMVNKNSVLQFQEPTKGARAYLAVKGGFLADTWLGSVSTNLKAGMGGYQGRGLRKNDQVFFREDLKYSTILSQKEYMILPWKADLNWNSKTEYANELFIIPGHEWDWLINESKNNFLNTSLTITQQSDRMGYRLNNIPLRTLTNEEIVSSAVSFGTVQLLPGGRLIILMADHQTTGGYPRIAHIISAHLPGAAQMKTGDSIRFKMTDSKTAEGLLIKQQQHLLQLQSACKFRLEEYLNS
ncbi:MAG: biotin-dependent carboxyltransferase family protein [Bacteroidetes bacterium]|nr:biotin-dependent carboxyltransferase family protein [Bacteroidota bacterium]MBS1932291.1 biotin-dependent carboxyltransferase family protein [Bacteroidota bacterium]